MIDLDARRDLIDRRITLNDHPAYIVGVREQFAMVRDAETHLGCQWSWEAVQRVIENGGHFRT